MKHTSLYEKVVRNTLAHPRRIFISRLAVVWMIVTIISVVIVALFGFKQINGYILNILKSESKQYLDLFKDFRSTGSSYAKARMENEAAKLLSMNFVIISLYDESKHIVFNVYRDDFTAINSYSDSYSIDLSENFKPVWKRFRAYEREYIILILPILDNDSGLIGFFRTVYMVNDEMLTGLKNLIALVEVIVSFIIFATLLIVYPIVFHLNKGLVDTSKKLLKSNIGMLKALGSAIAKRDYETSLHNYRVTVSSIILGDSVGLADSAIRGLIIGALLHDVGKIAIPDAILLKPNKLNDEEFEIMMTHVNNGLDIIKQYEWLELGVAVVGCHHEKFDGSGYPNGLEKEGIPITARIFAIVDVFDALTSNRPYKMAFSYEEAVSIMRDRTGTHFDPDLMDVFFSVSDRIYDLCLDIDEKTANSEFEKMVARYFPELYT